MSSEVGFAELPRQVHKRAQKRGFEFTLMVVGESGLGKSTLVNSLFMTDLYADREIPNANERIEQTVQLETSTVDIEEKGVRLRLTVVDTPGFGDAINNYDCWDSIIDYVDMQFDHYLRDESGVNRRNIADNRVHCCLYFISPSGHGLKPVDIEFMKRLHGKVNIIPVVAKADMLTAKELSAFKKKVMNEIQENGINIYTGGEMEDDENKELKTCIPFAVVGSNTLLEVGKKRVRGRLHPWGVVEVENVEHCDFSQLRNVLIRTHMQDLKDVTVNVHYENYRSGRLSKTGGTILSTADMSPAAPSRLSEADRMLAAKERELDEMRKMMEMMKTQMMEKKSTDGQSV
ncbi:septin-2-like [Sycon ciliatum]|uniref:septin-2-like n=1 Tax=Sycon ciliatum TaxID=27933 RepID=UPI0020AB110C|eukprot:scpid74836/ scgid10759/ Septin-2